MYSLSGWVDAAGDHTKTWWNYTASHLKGRCPNREGESMDNQNVIVIIMFYCMHSKSFAGHYDDANACGYEWYIGEFTLKKIVKLLFCNAHGFDIFKFDWICFFEVPCKSATNSFDSLC